LPKMLFLRCGLIKQCLSRHDSRLRWRQALGTRPNVMSSASLSRANLGTDGTFSGRISLAGFSVGSPESQLGLLGSLVRITDLGVPASFASQPGIRHLIYIDT